MYAADAKIVANKQRDRIMPLFPLNVSEFKSCDGRSFFFVLDLEAAGVALVFCFGVSEALGGCDFVSLADFRNEAALPLPLLALVDDVAAIIGSVLFAVSDVLLFAVEDTTGVFAPLFLVVVAGFPPLLTTRFVVVRDFFFSGASSSESLLEGLGRFAIAVVMPVAILKVGGWC